MNDLFILQRYKKKSNSGCNPQHFFHNFLLTNFNYPLAGYYYIA